MLGLGSAESAERAEPAGANGLLAQARFVVVGAGGLGCPALLGLVEAGARQLTIVDDDEVDASNLQRQVLFDTADVGARKTDAARWSLGRRSRAPLTVETVTRRLDPDDREGLAALVGGCGGRDDLTEPACVLECSDDPRLKFAVHDACFAAGVPVVVAGVIGWRGQVMAVDPRRPDLPCYRCLFESPPPRELAPACVAVGVIGAVAGFVGHAMALLAVGLVTGSREAAGALLHFDLLAGGIRRLAPAPRRDCRGCGGSLSTPAMTPT
jgi:molybdopterin/thiamine biosynthesis adenylyltransferase